MLSYSAPTTEFTMIEELKQVINWYVQPGRYLLDVHIQELSRMIKKDVVVLNQVEMDQFEFWFFRHGGDHLASNTVYLATSSTGPYFNAINPVKEDGPRGDMAWAPLRLNVEFACKAPYDEIPGTGGVPTLDWAASPEGHNELFCLSAIEELNPRQYMRAYHIQELQHTLLQSINEDATLEQTMVVDAKKRDHPGYLDEDEDTEMTDKQIKRSTSTSKKKQKKRKFAELEGIILPSLHLTISSYIYISIIILSSPHLNIHT